MTSAKQKKIGIFQLDGFADREFGFLAGQCASIICHEFPGRVFPESAEMLSDERAMFGVEHSAWR